MDKDIATIIIETIQDIFRIILKLPFDIWYAIPETIKYVIYVFLMLIMIGIVIAILKNKKEILIQLS